VVSTGDGRNGIAALTRVGEAYADFATKIRQAPTPKELAEEDRAQYRDELEQLAAPLEQRALETLQKGLAKAYELGIYTDWTLRAQDDVNTLSLAPTRRRLAWRSARRIHPRRSPRRNVRRRWRWARGRRDEALAPPGTPRRRDPRGCAGSRARGYPGPATAAASTPPAEVSSPAHRAPRRPNPCPRRPGHAPAALGVDGPLPEGVEAFRAGKWQQAADAFRDALRRTRTTPTPSSTSPERGTARVRRTGHARRTRQR
jgi:hypothetical protein